MSLPDSEYKSKSLSSSFDIVLPKHAKRRIPSASTALFIGSILGLLEALFLIYTAKPVLNFMGVKSVSSVEKHSIFLTQF